MGNFLQYMSVYNISFLRQFAVFFRLLCILDKFNFFFEKKSLKKKYSPHSVSDLNKSNGSLDLNFKYFTRDFFGCKLSNKT